MKTAQILLILALALLFVVSTATVSEAAQRDTAFTYEGRLIDVNEPADGLYDLQFKLYDDPHIIDGNQIGSTLVTHEFDVIDGYFMVELDFGSDPNIAGWLQIGVRPGELEDPNEYTILEPRQPIMPVPYAATAGGIVVSGEPLIIPLAGTANEFYGTGAGVSITAGSYNSAMGYYALADTNTGSYNSAMGAHALYSNTTGSYNSAMGRYALYSNATGISNSAVGYQTLYSNTTGSSNSAMGYFALRYNTLGYSNSAMGYYALQYNTTGSHNSAIGEGALQSNTTGHDNSAIGVEAGYNNSTGSGNVFLGCEAGYYETGSNKLYIANSEADPPLIYGEFDTGRVGIDTTSPISQLDIRGTDNPAQGSDWAEISIGDNDNDERRVAISAYRSNVGVDWDHMGIAFKAHESADDTVAPVTQMVIDYDGSVGIGTTSPGYRVHVVGDIAYTGDVYALSDSRVKENITPLRNAVEKVSSLCGIYFNKKGEPASKREVGVTAQNVEAVLPEAVSEGDDGYKSVAYSKLTALLIEAVKEQQKQLESLQQRIESLENTVSQSRATADKAI
jgi:hypothetical protein